MCSSRGLLILCLVAVGYSNVEGFPRNSNCAGTSATFAPELPVKSFARQLNLFLQTLHCRHEPCANQQWFICPFPRDFPVTNFCRHAASATSSPAEGVTLSQPCTQLRNPSVCTRHGSTSNASSHLIISVWALMGRSEPLANALICHNTLRKPLQRECDGPSCLGKPRTDGCAPSFLDGSGR